MVEVFIVITLGRDTAQRLCGTGVTATSGCLGVGGGGVDAKAVGLERSGVQQPCIRFLLPEILYAAASTEDIV